MSDNNKEKSKPKLSWDDWSFFLIVLPILAVMFLVFILLP